MDVVVCGSRACSFRLCTHIVFLCPGEEKTPCSALSPLSGGHTVDVACPARPGSASSGASHVTGIGCYLAICVPWLFTLGLLGGRVMGQQVPLGCWEDTAPSCGGGCRGRAPANLPFHARAALGTSPALVPHPLGGRSGLLRRRGGFGRPNCRLCSQSAHMAMVDALMMAYTVEMISIEKVVASVKRFSTFSASKELPYDLEDAMVFWVNKVSARAASEGGRGPRGASSSSASGPGGSPVAGPPPESCAPLVWRPETQALAGAPGVGCAVSRSVSAAGAPGRSERGRGLSFCARGVSISGAPCVGAALSLEGVLIIKRNVMSS